MSFLPVKFEWKSLNGCQTDAKKEQKLIKNFVEWQLFYYVKLL